MLEERVDRERKLKADGQRVQQTYDLKDWTTGTVAECLQVMRDGNVGTTSDL